jgi:hypothetical protein
MTKIRLTDGVEIIAQVGLDEVEKAFEKAVNGGHVIVVKSTDGTVKRVNPGQILYFEDAANGNGNGRPRVLASSTPSAERA